MTLIGTMSRTSKGKEPGLRVIYCNLCSDFIRSEEAKNQCIHR